MGADAVVNACNTSKTFQEACLKLHCDFRYLKSAAIELGCFSDLRERSKKYSHRSLKNSFDSGYLDKVFDKSMNKNKYVINSSKWCEALFSGKVKTTNSTRIKERLFEAGLKEKKCECCGITSWNGKEISFQLHHIDGNKNNNTLSNFEILCPNCHSQTDNYGSKNKK